MKWQKTSNRIRSWLSITEGLPNGEAPDFSLRGPVEHIHIKSLPAQSDRPLDDVTLFNGAGSQAMAIFWMANAAFALMHVIKGGNGLWLVWMGLTTLFLLRQTTNIMNISTQKITLRTGLLGYREIVVPLCTVNAIWVQQGVMGRLLDVGRVGLRQQNGDIVWSPVLSHPLDAKAAVLLAARIHNGEL